jgi:hypothetical protein
MFLDPHPAQSVSEPTKKGGKKKKPVLEGKQPIAGLVTWDIFSKNI